MTYQRKIEMVVAREKLKTEQDVGKLTPGLRAAIRRHSKPQTKTKPGEGRKITMPTFSFLKKKEDE